MYYFIPKHFPKIILENVLSTVAFISQWLPLNQKDQYKYNILYIFLYTKRERECVYVYKYMYISSYPLLPTSPTESKGRVKTGRLKGGILSLSLDGYSHFYPVVFQMFSPVSFKRRYMQGKAEILSPLSNIPNILLGKSWLLNVSAECADTSSSRACTKDWLCLLYS